MFEYSYKALRIKALGIGGVETVYIFPELGIAFDIGRCPYELVDIPKVFLTHGHLDHSAGLPYYFSQRSLKRLAPGEVFAPKEIIEPLEKILKLWQQIEGFEYPINLKSVSLNDSILIKNDYYVKPLKAYHRIPANGYALIRKSKKLKSEFIHLSGTEIKKRKENNEDIFEIKNIPIFAFSGDTTIEFVKENKEAQNAQVLFLECTYIDQKRPVSRARQWGHTHLDEIIENERFFNNEKIVLTHFSKRYSYSVIKNTLKEKLPKSLQNRVEVLF